MMQRCPGSVYIGTAILSEWRWIINIRGYANIIPSPNDKIYGMVYTLTEDDENKLDGFEGVPRNYEKKILAVEMLKGENKGTLVDALVYVDVQRLDEGLPPQEYIRRLNHAFKDGEAEGIPQEYIEKYVRKFVPERPLQN
ncbi:hypothetical protein H0H92_012100 [Tricholoma furcatifolium]|nr:hypothetical protein H0H92_012100 [Tricholoma furcatifolium]